MKQLHSTPKDTWKVILSLLSWRARRYAQSIVIKSLTVDDLQLLKTYPQPYFHDQHNNLVYIITGLPGKEKYEKIDQLLRRLTTQHYGVSDTWGIC